MPPLLYVGRNFVKLRRILHGDSSKEGQVPEGSGDGGPDPPESSLGRATMILGEFEEGSRCGSRWDGCIGGGIDSVESLRFYWNRLFSYMVIEKEIEVLGKEVLLKGLGCFVLEELGTGSNLPW